jgi:hypothetical protein
MKSLILFKHRRKPRDFEIFSFSFGKTLGRTLVLGLVRIGRLLQGGEECCIGDYRLNWAIDHAQRILGDNYWDALDEQNPSWLEDRFEQVSAACGLDL